MAGIACAPGERPPRAPLHGAHGTQGTLLLGTRSEPPKPAAPFAVVFAAPSGAASTAAEVSLVFSRPLRGLETAENRAVPAISITPPIPGQWLWVGARALRFVPSSARLPAASKFTVEVPVTVRALDGSALAQPYRFDFETPRPSVASFSPANGERNVDVGVLIALELNQIIDLGRLERAATLTAARGDPEEPTARGKALSFTLSRPNPAEPKRLVVRPKRPLPVDSAITFSIGESLVGEEGPLATGKTEQVVFHTYGPLGVASIDCDTNTPHRRCAPGSSLGVSFTNPVRWKDVRHAFRVTPPVAFHVSGGDDDDFTEYVDLSGPFRAGGRYVVTVRAGLTDKYGQRLAPGTARPVVMDDYFPSVDLGVRGETLTSSAPSVVQIGSVNVPSYEVITAVLAPTDLAALFATNDARERRDRLASLPGARSRKVTTGARTNQLAKEPLSVEKALGRSHGVLGIGVRYAEDPKSPHDFDPFRLLKVTDLAISAKVSRQGSLVWVTHLSTGAPYPDATVELERKGVPARRYRTDAQGFATIPKADYAPDLYADGKGAHAIIVAESGDDWTFERVEDHVPEWRTSVATDLSGREPVLGMMFTDRGIYRPGDTVRVKGIVRQETPTGSSTPSGARLSLELHSPDDEIVLNAKVQTTRFGTFSADLLVPRSGRLGNYEIKATGLGGEPISERFDVAEYRPAEFKTTVSGARAEYVRGDTAHFDLAGDYLFGAPMGGAKAHYVVARGPTGSSIPGSDGFVTDSQAYHDDVDRSALTAGPFANADVALDAKGRFGFDAKLDLPGQYGPEAVRVDAEITDVSRKSVAGGTTVLVHPAEFYVGLGVPEDAIVDAPGDVRPAVVALGLHGKRLAGKRVHVELVSRRWTLAREALPSGRSHVVSQVVDRVVGKCDVTTAAAPVSCALPVGASGYYVVMARARDARGNTAEAAYGVYATGAGVASYGDQDDREVGLVPNKKQYRVGETARVLVKSPFAKATALVTVERAGVYRRETVHLEGGSPTVSVPITEDMRPNAFVSVLLLEPQAAKSAGDAPYRIGYAPLAVETDSRRIRVTVKPSAKELLPGQEVAIDMDARLSDGKPVSAELTVYAVDEGALMLTSYSTPDPLPIFTALRPLQVATLETRASLAKMSLADFASELGAEKGLAGGGGGESRARSDLKQTAYFNPSVLTDANGHATVRFKMPDGLSTYRVMAVAVSEGDEYGFGSASVVTSKRLMARPALPRFIRAGDRLDAGVVVSAKGFGPASVSVRATVKGLVLDGEATKTVVLPRDSSVEVRFAMHADSVGEATLRFDASSGAERDAVSVIRAVRAPAAVESAALYGSTEHVAAEALGDYANVRHDTGGLELTLSSSALVGLSASAVDLTEYPYSCSEQLASRLLPLSPLRELATAFGFTLPKDADAVIGRTIGDLLTRQRGDGGFGMWPESSDSNPWVSAYATWVLDQSAAHGASVPKPARKRAHAYLRQYLEGLDAEPSRRIVAAFAVDVLADAGMPDPGYMTRLFDVRRELPLFARAFLLHALAVGKGPKATAKTLAAELSSELRISNDSAFVAENVGDDYAVMLDSKARTAALVLRALIAADPKHPLAAPLARGLLSQRRNGTWGTTQETAYALVALDAYRRAFERETPKFDAKVWLGQAAVRATTFDGKLRADTTFVPLAKLPETFGKLTFEKSGEGTLFYQARLSYVPRSLPSTSLDAGFTVEKAERVVDANSLSAALRTIGQGRPDSFRGGDLVLTDLVVVAPSPRDYVVIDDPLPAGFEAVDESLATTASWLGTAGSAGIDEDEEDCDDCESERDRVAGGRGIDERWDRREIRDDRVLFFVDHMAAGLHHFRYLARAATAGSFVLPPVEVKEMYAPETFGRTGADRVVVR